MTYFSRNKTDFIHAFNKVLNSKFYAASIGVDSWRSLSDFAGKLAAGTNLDREFFYKSGSIILRPVIKDILQGYTIDEYELNRHDVLVVYVGEFVQFEVRKSHRDTFEYRVVKAK